MKAQLRVMQIVVLFEIQIGMLPRCRLAFAGTTTDRAPQPYFVAVKRLSKELEETTGWAPATMASFGAAADAVDWLSAADDGFGGLAACLVSAGFAFDLASAALGLAGTEAGAGGVVAVVSAVAPPRPILWARLEKKPSDCASLAEATRVGAGAVVAGAEAGAATVTAGWSFASGACGGLTVPGMVPGTCEAKILFMPPSMPVLSLATGVPLATSFSYSAWSWACLSRTRLASSSGITYGGHFAAAWNTGSRVASGAFAASNT